MNTPCPRCQGDGYLDESTLALPLYCDCQAGLDQRAKAVAQHDTRAILPEAPVVPQEDRSGPEATTPTPQALPAPVTPPRSRVGTFQREEGGYCYVEGVGQGLRRGWDIESGAKVGDTIECTYGPRHYGYGWYGKVVK